MEEYRQRHREAYERRLAEQHARDERERQQQQQEGTAAAEEEEESRRSASAVGGQSFLSEGGVASVSSPPVDCSTRTSGDGCSGDGSCSTAGRLQDVRMDTAAAADAATVAAEAAAEAASIEEARRLQRQFEAELEGVRPPDDTYQERLIGEDGPAATMLSWWSQAAQLPLDRLGGREAASAAATAAGGGSAAAAAGRAARREAKAINRHLSRPGGGHASASAAEQSYISSSSSSRQLTAGVTAASVRENFNTGGVPEAAWERELLEQQHQLMNEQQQSPHAEEDGDAALARRLQVEELRRGRPQQQASIRRSRSPADQAPVSSSSDVSDVAAIDSCPAADALAGCVLNPLIVHASDALESSYTSAEGSGVVSPPRSVATPTLTTAARVLPGGRGAAATSARRPENVEAGDAHDVIVIDDPENPSSADENSRGHEALAPPPVQRSTFAFSVPPFPAAPPAATSFTPEQCLHEHANIVPGTSSLVPVDPEDEAAAAAAAAGIDVDSEEAILQAAIAQSLVDM